VLLLDAGFDLLGSQGLAATTVRGVCAKAQLNARYFYESFPDIDALIVAVFDRTQEELRSTVEPDIEAVGRNPLARIRATVAGTAEFVDTDRRRARVLYVEGRGHAGLAQRRAADALRVAGVIAVEAATTEPSVVSRAVGAFLVGGLRELLVTWLSGEIDADRDEIVEVAIESFVAVGRAARRLQSR
jgi:AcrR family transcriptional regulator